MRLPDISYLTNVYFHCGAIAVLPHLRQSLEMTRPLLVSDEGVMGAGILEKLGLGDCAIFHDVITNPTEIALFRGLQSYRVYQCDSVIAVGGGSPMDLAKGIALMANHAPPLEQYAFISGGMGRITANVPPLIAIPTTAGSGSEVGRATLITLNSGRKLGFISPYLLPKAAICDPLLTITMPRGLIAATGMDALSHCIEAFCSPRNNPVADAIALDGLKRGYQNLELAVREPENLESRSEMMLSALEGGLSFQKGLGAVHALSHPLGSLSEKRLHHGVLNAIFLPHVLRFNSQSCARKMSLLACALGMEANGDVADALTELNRKLGLPQSLSVLGLTLADLEPLIDQAVADHCSATNPRSLDPESVRGLYTQAL